jgi:hypothetical protein
MQSVGRPKDRWKYDIKIDLKEIGCEETTFVRLGMGTIGAHI